MTGQEQRQQLICKLLESNEIENQYELMELMAAEGMPTPQATLSRDMRKLGVIRLIGKNGNYVYKLRPADVKSALQRRPLISPTKGYINYSFSGNMLIVHTMGGFAHSVSVEIESRRRPEIAGTLAGDDTILILPNDGYGREELRKAILEIVGVRE